MSQEILITDPQRYKLDMPQKVSIDVTKKIPEKENQIQVDTADELNCRKKGNFPGFK